MTTAPCCPSLCGSENDQKCCTFQPPRPCHSATSKQGWTACGEGTPGLLEKLQPTFNPALTPRHHPSHFMTFERSTIFLVDSPFLSCPLPPAVFSSGNALPPKPPLAPPSKGAILHSSQGRATSPLSRMAVPTTAPHLIRREAPKWALGVHPSLVEGLHLQDVAHPRA